MFHEHRYPDGRVIEGGAMAVDSALPELLSMGGGQHEEGLLRQALRLKAFPKQADLPIDVRDGAVVNVPRRAGESLGIGLQPLQIFRGPRAEAAGPNRQ